MREINKDRISPKNFKEAVEYFKGRGHIAQERIKQAKEDLANGVNPFLDIDKIYQERLKQEKKEN